LAAVVATMVGAVLVHVKRRDDRATATWLGCVAALGLGTISQMLQRADATHVRIVACVILPLACVAVAVTLASFDARLPRAAIACEALGLAGLVLVLGVPYYAARLAIDTSRVALGSDGVAEAGVGDRRFPVAAPTALQVNELLARLRETGGQRVFVGPKDLRLANYSDAFVYFLIGERFRPASFYLESNPGMANADDSDLADDLRTADVLVLTDIYDRWDEPNTSRRRGPAAPQHVADTEFCTAASLERYEIRVRC
jgi:hypothetical protein